MRHVGIQSWLQSRPSAISFRTPTRAFDPETNSVEPEARRQADAYIFAVLEHPDKTSIDPLNVHQWEFDVVSSARLDARIRTRRGLSLLTLKGFCDPITYSQLCAEVLQVANARI
jgi:hypothetical protein